MGNQKMPKTAMAITSIPFKEDQNSFMTNSLKTTVLGRERFGFGLKKMMSAAHYFAKKAEAREIKILKKGKIPEFSLNFLEIELEVFSGGDVGLASLKGISVMELFLTKRN
jgi:hypothetical protein